jgi:integrase
MLFNELAERFLRTHAQTVEASTRKAMEQILAAYLVPRFGTWLITDITEADILDWADEMRGKKSQRTGRPVSAKTVNNRLSVLRTVLQYAKSRKLIDAVPPIAIKAIRQQDPQFLSVGDALALVEAIEDPIIQQMAVVALYTGMRVGELRALQWKHIDLKRRVIRVQRATWSWTREEKAPKSGKPRSVPIHVETERALRVLVPQGPYVFGEPLKGTLIGYDRCIVAMRNALKAVGLDDTVAQPWHIFRHTFASHSAMAGVPIPVLQKILGHANISTTMRYAHLSEDAGLDAIQKLSNYFAAKNPIRTKT